MIITGEKQCRSGREDGPELWLKKEKKNPPFLCISPGHLSEDQQVQAFSISATWNGNEDFGYRRKLVQQQYAW